MDEPSIEYLAGFFDGEGCILIASSQSARRAVSRNYALTVVVANTYRPILESFQSRFGGCLHTKQVLPGQKRKYDWVISGKMAQSALEQLYPSLREKREQAWLGLEFMAQRTIFPGRSRVTEEEIALREGFRIALQNAKGRPKLR